MNQTAHQDVANAESETDAELARRAGAGEQQAFALLVDRYQAAVFRMIFYRTRSRPDAEDITQEVFMRAFDRLPGLKDAGKFRSWLFSIAVNRTRDFHRKQRLLAFVGLTAGETPGSVGDPICDSSLDPQERLIRQDFWDQVGAFLDRLSRMEREVFLLRFWDQLMLNEIARVLGKSESTVKTHLYRALSKFKNSTAINQLLRETINGHSGE
jgi:RNA polymerase sigma-70 factor (ECF subfamily)